MLSRNFPSCSALQILAYDLTTLTVIQVADFSMRTPYIRPLARR
jgi:hypothetical protein